MIKKIKKGRKEGRKEDRVREARKRGKKDGKKIPAEYIGFSPWPSREIPGPQTM